LDFEIACFFPLGSEAQGKSESASFWPVMIFLGILVGFILRVGASSRDLECQLICFILLRLPLRYFRLSPEGVFNEGFNDHLLYSVASAKTGSYGFGLRLVWHVALLLK
jgi:hypothetical protein